MKISFLNENTANKRGFLGELGLSLLIEWDGGKILFDTGQTDVFLRNAARMGADLEGLSAIVLSHGHFDHCGGLEYLLEGAADLPPVYVRRSAFEDKQAVNADGKTYRKIGIPWREELKERRRELLERSSAGPATRWRFSPASICWEISLTPWILRAGPAISSWKPAARTAPTTWTTSSFW